MQLYCEIMLFVGRDLRWTDEHTETVTIEEECGT